MRANGIRKIAFASTGSVYGETTVFPTPEDAPFPVQTSLYGASKLACEGLIAAYCEGFAFQSWIFRLVSILGERYSHGHVFDFCKQLRSHPTELTVLGNGRQRKSYLYIQDCLDAVLLAMSRANARVNVLNLGVDSYCEVNDSIGWISAGSPTPAAIAAGWVTTRSSFSIRREYAPSAGGRSSASTKAYGGLSHSCTTTHGFLSART
jgi:UDP-glucose 4-epimerase